LGSRFALPVGGALSAAVLNEKYSHVRKFTEIRITRSAVLSRPRCVMAWPVS
jgi:hypothetical protein